MKTLENVIISTFENKDSNIAKDLKLNFKRYLEDGALDEKTRTLVAYSLSSILHLNELKDFAHSQLTAFAVTSEQIHEASEIGAFMKMLNTYYKFKNFVNNDADYNSAGLRMNAMARPNLSKTEFEILAFAHSLLNGCEFCVKAHEQELRKHNVSVDQIHDIARLASILSAVSALNYLDDF